MIAALTLIIRGLLFALAVAIAMAVLHQAARRPPPRRAEDPAADPHTEPYGECPGFSRSELKPFDVVRQRRGERGVA